MSKVVQVASKRSRNNRSSKISQTRQNTASGLVLTVWLGAVCL
jgi:hypothetical protein